ncbi:MAG: PCMD domain-containing protein [Dysgonomonas sp.]|nr:PCMD domain-containing protein [Dysgonomonas sp.]
MKTNVLLIIAFLGLSMASCIKDEPLNREADIVDVFVDNGTFIDRSIAMNDTVQLILSDEADLTKVAPLFKVSPGATISPASGDTVDLSDKKVVTYEITSEDGKYKKTYGLVVTDVKLKYNFENWTSAGTEDHPYPVLRDAMWSNANAGVITAVLIGAIPRPDPFPTDKTTDCVEGKYAASLTTIEGGKIFGKNYPIFAGNLLRGDFKANMFNPLKSLYLGRNHPEKYGKPVFFTGYYKYTPGEKMIGSDGQDQMSMYAALFRVTKGAAPNKEYLDGETILTSDRVVARAEWRPDNKNMTEIKVENGFTQFSIPFKYYPENLELDYENNDYRLTIVCSSSKDGNLYIGAVGSNLTVDELEVVCDPIIK